MFKKSILISGLVGLIIHNSMIYLFYRVLALDIYQNHVLPFQIPHSINMGYIVFGGFVISIILAFLIAKYIDHYEFATGFNFGVSIGILIGYGDIIASNGLTKAFDMKILFINALWYLLMYGTIGGAIGFTLKKFNP